MNILLTGGGGFIGSAVADRLLREGHALRILERSSVTPWRSFSADERIEWRAGDLLEPGVLTEALTDMDMVIHLAGSAVPADADLDPSGEMRAALRGASRLAMAMHQRGVRQLLLASSGGTVYGEPACLPIGENHPTRPVSAHGKSKLAVEQGLAAFAHQHGWRLGILRLGNPYGERQRQNGRQGVVTHFMRRHLAGQPVEIWGDGQIVRDYLYISDVAEAFARLVVYSGNQMVFNIGSGQGLSLDALIDRIERTCGDPVKRLYRSGRLFDVSGNVLDSSLAARELGWQASLSLDEGLRLTWDALLSGSANRDVGSEL